MRGFKQLQHFFSKVKSLLVCFVVALEMAVLIFLFGDQEEE